MKSKEGAYESVTELSWKWVRDELTRFVRLRNNIPGSITVEKQEGLKADVKKIWNTVIDAVAVEYIRTGGSEETKQAIRMALPNLEQRGLRTSLFEDFYADLAQRTATRAAFLKKEQQ